VIRADVEHRKIVVIDGETALLGSLNAPSPNKSQEIKATEVGGDSRPLAASVPAQRWRR